MYDLIIMGAGPAGISAGIYAARKGMNFLVISKDLGGQTLWVNNVDNYTGYVFISGKLLVEKFSEQVSLNKIKIRENETIVSVAKNGDSFYILTDKGNYEARTLIIASGRMHKKLGVAGEDEFRNKGVAYCATCDAPVFAGKDVAVVGGGNSALDAAIQLLKVASRIFMVNEELSFRADPAMVEKVVKNDKAVIYHSSSVEKIYGDKFVQGITIKQDGGRRDLKVQGVFVEAGTVASSDFIDLVSKNDKNEIIVDSGSRTDVPGIFAAGDVTDVPAKQMLVACGEGVKAALGAYDYLIKNRV